MLTRPTLLRYLAIALDVPFVAYTRMIAGRRLASRSSPVERSSFIRRQGHKAVVRSRSFPEVHRENWSWLDRWLGSDTTTMRRRREKRSLNGQRVAFELTELGILARPYDPTLCNCS